MISSGGVDAIAITPNGQTAYVADNQESQGTTVSPISTATNTAGKATKVGIGPEAIAITPNNQTAAAAPSGRLVHRRVARP